MKKLLCAMCVVTLGLSFANGESTKNKQSFDALPQLLSYNNNEHAFIKLWNSLNNEQRTKLIIEKQILDELLEMNVNQSIFATILNFCYNNKLNILTVKKDKNEEQKIKICTLPVYYEKIITNNDLCLLF